MLIRLPTANVFDMYQALPTELKDELSEDFKEAIYHVYHLESHVFVKGRDYKILINEEEGEGE